MTEAGRRRSLRGIADDPFRPHVAARLQVENQRRVIAEVRHPQLVVLLIYGDSHGSVDARARPLDYLERRYIAAVAAMKEQYGIIYVIGDDDFVVEQIHVNAGRPTQLRG